MGRREKNSILSARGFGAAVLLSLLAAAAGLSACGRTEEKLARISPENVTREFFEAWQKKDWKGLYRLTHPAFIQSLRMQKLSPEQRAMSDEDLFVSEFSRAQRMNPDKTLKTYRVISFSEYKRGDTTVWLYALVNGRKRKIPLTLDGLSLKIDMTRIE